MTTPQTNPFGRSAGVVFSEGHTGFFVRYSTKVSLNTTLFPASSTACLSPAKNLVL
jgi:hypothetical protein